ncbi:DUF3221 domain-containing protein [Rummeliibacillus sp. NPDC094406]|uniref:DUF3221 domain-containing protein n=1 Tax=Rummeliibacillus sp. NPDC094406 TaxID=3364511 RepID=UPI003819833F
MNKIDFEDLNNLIKSKEKVVTNVLRHIENQTTKKDKSKWGYGILTLFVTGCMFLFIFTQIIDSQNHTANEVPILEKNIFDINIKSQLHQNTLSVEEAEYKAFYDSLQHDANYAYALNKGIVLTENEINNKEKEFLGNLEELKQDPKKKEEFKELLGFLRLTEQQMIDQYIKPQAIKTAAFDQLVSDYYKKHKDAYELHVITSLEQDAMNYLSEKYPKKIANLQGEYDIPKKSKEMGNFLKIGLVVAIEDDKFLVVNNASDEDLSQLSSNGIVKKHKNGTWFPLHHVKQKIRIGDKVQVSSNRIQDTFPEVANLVSIKLLNNK